MIRINAFSIPHEEHPYPTVGNYWIDADGVLQIRTSELSDWRMELLICVHELIESSLCRHRGITDAEIVRFDEKFEAERARGLHENDAEPGFDQRAPYRTEHTAATGLEMTLAAMLDVDWAKYSDEVSALP